MPNHIRNRLTFDSKEEAQIFFDQYSTHYAREPRKAFDGRLVYKKGNDYGWLDEETGLFEVRGEEPVKFVPDGYEKDFKEAWDRFPDFNKIIPMPEGIELEIHSGIETAIEAALKMPLSDNELLASLEAQNRKNFKSPLEFNDEEFEKYLLGLKNVREHGYINWYSWSIANWGTKWNSYESTRISETVFEFDTAWSCVEDLIAMISKANPNIKFFYQWSDEDTSSNCGEVFYKDGPMGKNIPENGSKEAYEIAFELRPEYKENYVLENGNYEYAETD